MKLSAKDVSKPVGRPPRKEEFYEGDPGFIENDPAYDAYCAAIKKAIYRLHDEGIRATSGVIRREMPDWCHDRFRDAAGTLIAAAVITEMVCGEMTRYEPREPPNLDTMPFTAFSVAPPSPKTQPDSDSFRGNHRVTA